MHPQVSSSLDSVFCPHDSFVNPCIKIHSSTTVFAGALNTLLIFSNRSRLLLAHCISGRTLESTCRYLQLFCWIWACSGVHLHSLAGQFGENGFLYNSESPYPLAWHNPFLDVISRKLLNNATELFVDSFGFSTYTAYYFQMRVWFLPFWPLYFYFFLAYCTGWDLRYNVESKWW